MKLINKILFATDFGAATDASLEVAIHLGHTFNTKISILTVVPELDLPELQQQMIESGAEKELKKLAQKLSDRHIEVSNIKVKKGVPFIGIMEEANLYDVNVIVIGSGNAGGEKEYELGLTAEKVLQKSKKPVWVVRPDFKSGFNKIMCAVDFSNPSERALRNAIHLSRKFNAHLDVITVVPELTGFYSKLLGNRQDKLEKMRTQHKNKFEEFIKKFDLHNVDWDSRLLEGIPEEEINRFAEGQKPDVLLMGTVGQDDSFKMQMGSVAKKVARALPSSLITFRSENLIQLHLDQQLSDIAAHFQLGQEMMENGFPEEALNQFRICIEDDLLYAPAYEASAEALERLGKNEEAATMRNKADEIRSKLWQRNVESEIRGRHDLYNKKQ